MNCTGLMDVKEVAKYLKVSPGWVYQACRERAIPHRKLGAKYIFIKKDIDNFLEDITVHTVDSDTLAKKVVGKSLPVA